MDQEEIAIFLQEKGNRKNRDNTYVRKNRSPKTRLLVNHVALTTGVAGLCCVRSLHFVCCAGCLLIRKLMFLVSDVIFQCNDIVHHDREDVVILWGVGVLVK